MTFDLVRKSARAVPRLPPRLKNPNHGRVSEQTTIARLTSGRVKDKHPRSSCTSSYKYNPQPLENRFVARSMVSRTMRSKPQDHDGKRIGKRWISGATNTKRVARARGDIGHFT